MKSKIAKGVWAFLFLAVTLFNMIGLAIDSFWYDMKDLPTGEFLYASMSPDGKNTLKVYRVSIPQIGTAVRGELVLASAAENAARNIYWETDMDTAIAAWTEETQVTINGNEVNINGSPFDSRRQIVLPEASAKKRLQ